MLAEIDTKFRQYGEIAHKIWIYADMGYQEGKSADLLQKTLKTRGFR